METEDGRVVEVDVPRGSCAGQEVTVEVLDDDDRDDDDDDDDDDRDCAAPGFAQHSENDERHDDDAPNHDQ